MSRNIFVDLPNQLVWPDRCAMCDSKNTKLLGAFSTSEEKKSGIGIPIPFVGALYLLRTIEVNISYPICKRCAEKCKTLDFLSGRLPIVCMIAMVVTFAVLMQSAGGYWPKWLSVVGWFLVVVEFIVFVICGVATTKVPVRIHNLGKNSVELVFSSDRYSKEFESLNQPYARYMSKVRSAIGLKG